MTAPAFWIVWSPQGEKPPRCRHRQVSTAEAEAQRLARENPGTDFYVLRAIGHAHLPTGVQYALLEGALDMDVPF